VGAARLVGTNALCARGTHIHMPPDNNYWALTEIVALWGPSGKPGGPVHFSGMTAGSDEFLTHQPGATTIYTFTPYLEPSAWLEVESYTRG